MRKTRLNKILRSQLHEHAVAMVEALPKLIKMRKDLETLNKNVRAAAYRLATSILTETDIKTLRKFNVLTTLEGVGNEVRLHAQDAWANDINWQNHYILQLQAGEKVYLPAISLRSNIPIRATHPFWSDVQEITKQRNIINEYRYSKLQPYKKLIEGSRTLEQVIDVWPEADIPLQGLSAPKKNELAALTDSDIKAIIKDMDARNDQATT